MEDRFAQSDLVCAGRVLSVSQPSPWPLDNNGKLAIAPTSAQISIVSLYRGGGSERTLVISFPATDPMTGVPVVEGHLDLFFLRHGRGNAWELLDTSGSVTPLGAPAGNSDTSARGLAGLEADVAAGLRAPDQRLVENAMEVLLEFRSLHAGTIQAVHQVAERESEIGLMRLSLLARYEPEEYMPELLDAALSATPRSPVLLNAMDDLIGERTKFNDLPELQQIVRAAAFPYFRIVAQQAIRRLKRP